MKHERNEDGTVTVKGAGWFWVRINASGHVVEHAPGMKARPSCRGFVKQAKAYFAKIDEPEPTGPEPGTYAYTARFLAASGLMDGDEADRWKDEMKERDL